MPGTIQYRNFSILSELDDRSTRSLVDAVIEETLTLESVFRDNWRTLSAQVRFQQEALLLKVPRARNKRRWERLLTFFRSSDAHRQFRHLALMSSLGLAAPVPVIACEKRRRGVVVDAFLCYRYVEGRPAEPRDARKILAALRVLHGRGFLRSDAQLANFLIRGDEVVFIDFRLKRPWVLPGLQKARELDRFLRSCPEAGRLLSPAERSSFWLKAAHGLESIRFAQRRLKQSLRRRKKAKSVGHR